MGEREDKLTRADAQVLFLFYFVEGRNVDGYAIQNIFAFNLFNIWLRGKKSEDLLPSLSGLLPLFCPEE